MRWVGEIRNSYTILVVQREGKRLFRNLIIGGGIILKRFLKKLDGGDLRFGTVLELSIPKNTAHTHE